MGYLRKRPWWDRFTMGQPFYVGIGIGCVLTAVVYALLVAALVLVHGG